MKKSCISRTQGPYRAALAPYSVWSLLFVIVPLVFVAYYAFTDNSFSFTTENITRFFTATSNMIQDDGTTTEVRTYLLIFGRSLKLAVISTLDASAWMAFFIRFIRICAIWFSSA